MPTYVYECKDCRHRFEIFQRFADDPLTTCSECQKVTLRRVLFPAGVVFKGSGFYVTDSRRPSPSGRKDGASPPASSSSDKSEKKKPAQSANGKTATKEPARSASDKDS